MESNKSHYIWQDKGKVIKANWWQYSNYRQKIHQDNNDNIYLTYTYEIQTFNDTMWYSQSRRNPYDNETDCIAASAKASDCVQVRAEHDRLWADEPPVGTPTRREQHFQHNPSMISTSDLGETWTITTTKEFSARAKANPLVGLSVAEVEDSGDVTLYGFAKGGSGSYTYK